MVLVQRYATWFMKDIRGGEVTLRTTPSIHSANLIDITLTIKASARRGEERRLYDHHNWSSYSTRHRWMDVKGEAPREKYLHPVAISRGRIRTQLILFSSMIKYCVHISVILKIPLISSWEWKMQYNLPRTSVYNRSLLQSICPRMDREWYVHGLI